MNIEQVKKSAEKRDIKGLVKALSYNSEFASDEMKERIRLEAAKALVQINDPRAVELLIKVLTSGWSDNPAREWAAKVLGELKDPRALKPSIKTLDNKNANVCEAATKALGELNDKSAIEPLIKTLDSWRVEDIGIGIDAGKFMKDN